MRVTTSQSEGMQLSVRGLTDSHWKVHLKNFKKNYEIVHLAQFCLLKLYTQALYE